MRSITNMLLVSAALASTSAAAWVKGDPPGTRCTRPTVAGPAGRARIRPNRAPIVRLTAVRGRATPDGLAVRLRTVARDPDRDTLLYTYSVTGGRITGDGPRVLWTLTEPGLFTASVEVDDRHGCTAFASITQEGPAKH